MAERLARGEDVDDLTFVHELYRAAADHEQAGGRLAVLDERDGARRERAGLDGRRDPREPLGVEAVEGRNGCEEVGGLGHRRHVNPVPSRPRRPGTPAAAPGV